MDTTTSRSIRMTDRLILPTTTEGSPQSRLEPVDLETVKKALRFTSDSENDLILGWIEAARQHFEFQTGRQLLTAQREVILDGIPANRAIEIPRPPLQSVQSVVGVAEDGTETELDPDEYFVIGSALDIGSPAATGYIDPHCPPGVVKINASSQWPTIVDPGYLRIRYTAGYGDTIESIPQAVKAVLYYLIGHFHSHRNEVVDGQQYESPLGARVMIFGFRESAKLSQNLVT